MLRNRQRNYWLKGSNAALKEIQNGRYQPNP